MLRVALLLGGPSKERAISLNSARSVADHLDSDAISISAIVYFDTRERPYTISRKMLYSNTPGDFDFKLSLMATPLSRDALEETLKGCDIAFPVMHGTFGEDGGIQRVLESMRVPYVGTGPQDSLRAYDKFLAHLRLRKKKLATVPSILYEPCARGGEGDAADRDAITNCSRVIVKPAEGGSSLGVTSVAKAQGEPPDSVIARIFGSRPVPERTVLQPFVRGTEFTTVVLEGSHGPVALPPVEIELRNVKRAGDILSYRHKYLASDDARYHCPPRQENVVDALRKTAERAFATLGLRDFARIDCRLSERGEILISDVNPISGMEQNSFLFIAAAQVGMSHSDTLRFIVSAACLRAGIPVPASAPTHWGTSAGRTSVRIVFGGDTAERQVSVLSGTNVWLKLLHSERFAVAPYIKRGDSLWEVPYSLALRHSVEQILASCKAAPRTEALRRRLADDVARRLQLEPSQRSIDPRPPRRVTLDAFLSSSDFVFNALHGGMGENGTLQRMLTQRGIPYNGSGAEASALCMDKLATGERLAGLEGKGIQTARRVPLTVTAQRARNARTLWKNLVKECGTATVVVKPRADGCSVGVLRLNDAAELRVYLTAILNRRRTLPRGRFHWIPSDKILELPATPSGRSSLLFEQFIETDDILVVDQAVREDTGSAATSALGASSEPACLRWGAETDTGWIEVTVGVLGTAGAMHALPPSLTVARESVLSVEEKFMGGTGVNITPPPAPPLGRVAPAAVARVKELVGRIADRLGIEGYARIDAFMHRSRGDVVVIEANTLPGLSASTVLFHQGLEEGYFPRQLLEHIIELGLAARSPRLPA